MGVQNLWQILAPVKSTESIDVLKGRTVAVDLAIWLVESQVTGIKMMQGRVIKPHLRNLFFRVSNFLRLGVKLVFVIDGTPPELKWEEIARRNEARVGGGWRGKDRRRGRGGGVKKASRTHFTSWLKECQELLELMGVPCIQSKGEAEAMCAALNSAGMVDGCMTEDGDAFLYGAQVVYRNLNMSTGEVDCYSMDDIRKDLNLDRRRLIALAILLGCDYLPKGVPGVGKEVAMRFMNSLPSCADPLNLFQSWRGGRDSDSQTSEERSVKKKCLRVEGFPNDDVIKEFLQNKEKPSTCHMEWKRPLLLHLMQFNLVKMEWPVVYTQEKVVPLVTLYDLTHLTSDPKGRLHPASIVKLRVRQGVQCVEVKWHKPEEHKENDEDPDSFYTTVEERERFASAHPTMMQDFVVAMETKKVKGRGKKKRNPSLSSQQEGLMADEASQHASETNVPVIFDPQLAPKVNPEPPQIPSYPGIKQDGRETTSVFDDDDEMMKRLISLSLYDGGTRAEEGNERRGKEEQRCQKDDAMQKRTHRRKKETQNRAKKISRKKESSKGKDNAEDCSSVQLTQEGIPSMKSTCQVDARFANGLGTEETVKTIPDILKVVEDIDKEGNERRKELEEEQSFIEVLPLSQRLGSQSLQGFIPNSRRNRKIDSGSALKNAKQCASLSSTDDESEEGIDETLHFPEETPETDGSRLVHFTKTKNRDLRLYSSKACAESPQPSIVAAGKYEGCSSEGSIDQRQIGVREALNIIPPNGFKDKLKPTPACREDITINDRHTQPHSPNLTDEVIDLTGDSPLSDQRTSSVYSSEGVESTSHRLPSGRFFGIKHSSSDEIDFDEDSSHSLEDFTTCQEKPEPETISSVAFGHEQSRCRIGHNQFMKLDNSLAKFMNELSLVSKSATGFASFLEGDDSVFVIEDAECCLEDGQEITKIDERNGDKMKGLNNSYQCSARRQSSKGHANPPVLEGSDVVCDEEVTVKVLQSESTKTGEVGDIPKDHEQDRTNNYQDSSDESRLPIEFTLENGETRKVGEKIVHAEIENIAVSKQPQGKMKEKSCTGRIRKTRKRKAMTRNSLLIENDLLKILQTMSPVTGQSSLPGQQETVLPLEYAHAAEDLSLCSSNIDFKQGCSGLSAITLSSRFPTSASSSSHHVESQHETIDSCTTPSSSASFMSGSISTITPTLPRTIATANSKCSTLSISGEPQPTITNSSQEPHVASPSTKSSHLLREQLLSMLSQLTPGDSPLMGTKVIQKSQDLLPSCVGSQKSSGVGSQKVVKDDPAHATRDTLMTSTQHNHFQQISTTRTNRKCECDSVNSNVCGEETKSSPKLCKGDKCKPKPTQGSYSRVGESVSHNVCKPRTELKPRSHSQPSVGPDVTTKRSRSKPRSCSQPVRSRTKSRSKKSLRGSQKRESMLAMESNLGKILEGLSSPL
ncbi:uncharacterized protein LOC121417019 [Lytechinus variegatus]|uniref:uncharacterized protein LOC121417019 n=1 Tax=Lytechinus variegatus TaxID=7654 RepID=UPI001BB1317E|nr:uncharacterized protein LOC121417019 [Lytechinus variegatus]